METITELQEKCRKYRDTIAQQQNAISQLTGLGHPSRVIMEHALRTQPGSVLNIRKAQEEFHNIHRADGE